MDLRGTQGQEWRLTGWRVGRSSGDGKKEIKGELTMFGVAHHMLL